MTKEFSWFYKTDIYSVSRETIKEYLKK